MNGGNDLVCAVRGPIILITVGTLFALDHFTGYGFWQTWPVLLIVVGVLSLVRRSNAGWQRCAPPPAGTAHNPGAPNAAASNPIAHNPAGPSAGAHPGGAA